jgi:antitoxin MazE
MQNRVQKWGNSLAVRIPKTFARQMGWRESAPVKMSLEEGALVIKTDRERAWDLDALMSGVTDDNLHPAWEAEPAGPIAEDADGENVKGGGNAP